MIGLKILIVEDETVTALHLRQTLELAGYTVTGIARTLQAAIKLVKSDPPDLALIDIQLADESVGNGIDTATELREIHPMPIIYLTASSDSDTFQAAKETLPAAYLLKPFRADELRLHVELAYHYFQSTMQSLTGEPTPGYLFLPVGRGHEKIELDDVLYLEAYGAYARVFMADKTSHTVSTNLGQLEQYFRTPNFFRLSRFHVVNLNAIKRLKENDLLLIDGQTTLSVPASSRKELLKKLTVVRTKSGPDKR